MGWMYIYVSIRGSSIAVLCPHDDVGTYVTFVS